MNENLGTDFAQDMNGFKGTRREKVAFCNLHSVESCLFVVVTELVWSLMRVQAVEESSVRYVQNW